MKKIISLLVVVGMLFSFAVTGFAADTPKYKDDTVAVTVLFGGVMEEFPTIKAALDSAAKTGYEVYLVKEATLDTDLDIPQSVTFVIPSGDTLDETTDGNNDKAAANVGSPNMILHIPQNVTLTVSGTLLVAGNQQGGTGKTGFLYGDYGEVDLEGKIEVNKGGALYARGEVSGSGSVTVNEGGSVYQRFEISDWRGGNASYSAYSAHNIYPFNLYEARGLEVTATYNYGSKLYGQAYIYADTLRKGAISTVQMLGDDALITFDSTDTTSTVTFTRGEDDVSTATVSGKVKTGDIVVNIELIFGITLPLRSSNGVGPFGYKQNVVLKDGATFNVTNELKVLPGCTIKVAPNATLNAVKGMYFYTAGGYNRSWNNVGWPAENSGIGNATLEIEDGGHVIGIIGSTNDPLVNITGLGTLNATGSVIINEVTQSGNTVTPVNVTFHTVTFPTPAA